MKNKLTIYCCYHNKKQIEEYNLKETDNFKLFYGGDDPLNEFFNEFSMFYYIWKNDKDSDYIGLCHYRRQIYESDFDEDKVNDTSMLYYEGWECWHPVCNMICCHTMRHLYDNDEEFTNFKLDWFDFLKKFKDGKYLGNKCKNFKVMRSSGIITKKRFNEFCEFYFGFIDFLFKKYNVKKEKDSLHDFIKKYYIDELGEGHIVLFKHWYYNSDDDFKGEYYRFIAFVGEYIFQYFINKTMTNLAPIKSNEKTDIYTKK